MLSFLAGGRADHPLADPRRAGEILKDLPADPARALEEILALLDSVTGAQDLAPVARADAIEALDGAGQIHARKLARELYAARATPVQAQRLWAIGRAFWTRHADAWSTLIEDFERGTRGADGLKRSLPVIATRAARAWSHLGRWLFFAYGPRDEALWARLGHVVLFAEANDFARTLVTPYARVPFETSVQAELVRLAAFSVSSPGALSLKHMHVLDRLVGVLSKDLAMLTAHQPGAFYWLDLARSNPAARYATVLKARPTLRFFAPGRVVESIDTLVADLTMNNAVPERLGLPEDANVEDALAVLRHLRRQWVAPLPIRRHPRHAVVSRVSVTSGFDNVLDALTSESPGGTHLDFSQESPVESWITENLSLSGMAALAPPGSDQRLRIGQLLAVQPENTTDWRVGLVRRLDRLTDGHVAVAIEIVGPTPAAVEAYVESRGEISRMAEVAILLTTPSGTEGPMQLMVRAGVHASGDGYRVEHRGQPFTLEARKLAERGDDYEIVEGTIRRA